MDKHLYSGAQPRCCDEKVFCWESRVALLEMTNHEFLDASRSKERRTFADGTTVTVD